MVETKPGYAVDAFNKLTALARVILCFKKVYILTETDIYGDIVF